MDGEEYEYEYYEESYGSEEEQQQPKPSPKISGWKQKLLRVFHKEQKEEVKPQPKKIPKKFAELVLEEELKIDRGNFDIETVNGLLQLYNQAVDYYSDKNDDRYIYYSERIQRTLVKPEIIAVMRKTEAPEKVKPE